MKQSWQEYRVGELGKIVTGKTPSTTHPSYFGEEYPFITPSDMDGQKWANITERYLSNEGAKLLQRNLLPKNSVAVSCIGWQMGKVIMVSRPSFTNQQLNTIIPNENVYPDFLYYVFSTRKQELLSLGSATGVRTPILNKSAFSELKVNIPPLPIQCKIADVLSAYDDLIEVNTHRIRLLEQMAQSVYREWFGKVDERSLSEGWEFKKLGDVIELAYGKGLKADQRIEGAFPVYGSAGIVGYHNEYLVKSPGIIVGRKGNVGSVFWANKDFYPIDTTYFVRTHISLYYVFFNLQTQHFINNDAAVPGLSRNQAYSLPILVPSKETLNKFDEFIQPIFHQLEILRTKNANLRRTRDLLLPRLVSGEVAVHE
jgi:type I restriction enzyme, S subunit